jgi:hypothetical protein
MNEESPMTDEHNSLDAVLSRKNLDALFPRERTDQFFEALLGDAADGAYDIRLTYKGRHNSRLHFHVELHQRPGKCLACNLTYGLPQVFCRHPIIDLKGVVAQLDTLLEGRGRCKNWSLGNTETISQELHVIPLIIDI